MSLGVKLLDASPDCVKLITASGGLHYVNVNGACLLELDDVSDVYGMPWTELWPSESRFLAEQALSDAQSGQVAHFSGYCPTAKGTPRWWDVIVSPILDDAGKVIWLLAVSRDVSRFKSVETSLVVSEQRFRALADNIAQLAWMADKSGSVFWYNQRWFDYTGTTFDEMAGWGWKSVHHPDHIERVTEKITRHFESGEIWEDTFPLRGVDGQFRWFLSRAMPIRDEHGAVALWCGTNTDVTDQRNASQRLRQLARLIELSHEAILVWDLDEGIVLWNRGCEELYGYTSPEALGAKSHDLLQTQNSLPQQHFDDVLRTHGAWTGELRHVSKYGREVWVDSRQETVRIGGRRFVLETNRDITERRKNDHVRTLLIGELNHRVKNTLAIVQSIATQTARNTTDVRSFVNSFNSRVQSLSSAHNVLTDAHWQGASLRELISSQLAVTVADTAAISLMGEDIHLPPQTALQFTLIIHELAVNAVKFGALSRSSGRIEISWMRTSAEDRKLNLTWREVGGPLVQAPAARGFGLTLIERSANLPNVNAKLLFEPTGVVCHISADVTDGDDVDPVYFNLSPARTASTETPASVVPPRSAQPARRILIIEDEPMIAMELEEILADAGFTVAGQAMSVDDAVTAVNTLSFDAAIVDGNLLGQPVDRVVAALQARNAPFVMVTGFRRQNLPSTCAEAPVLMKPIQPSQLSTVLHSVIAAMPSR
ncbi:MAG: PAS domain-containing protein [Hyphomicrobium sp.]